MKVFVEFDSIEEAALAVAAVGGNAITPPQYPPAPVPQAQAPQQYPPAPVPQAQAPQQYQAPQNVAPMAYVPPQQPQQYQAAAAAPAYTVQDVTAAATAKARATSPAMVTQIFAKYGAKKASDVPVVAYPAIMADLQA